MTVYSLEAKQIIRAVVSDMRDGAVPVDTDCFQALHDSVDANEYFLQCTDVFDEGFDEAAFAKAGEIEQEVTWWLQHTPWNLEGRIAAKPVI